MTVYRSLQNLIPMNEHPTDKSEIEAAPVENVTDASEVISLKAQPVQEGTGHATEPDETTAEPGAPSFSWVSLSFLNLAIQQNRFSLVREVVVQNATDQLLEGLSCTISVSPASFAAEKTFPLENVPPGGQAVLRNVSPDLDFDRLFALTEAVSGSLALTIRTGETELFQEERPLEIFTPDQWTGPSILPELTAAFVMPNLPDIQQLVQAVSEELRETTDNPSINGYQAGKGRAYEILQACYRVLHGTGIRYAMPPASFAEYGQRFRLPDKVLADKLGTCIETTLLLASLAEACWLNPVIMLTRGHAYLGCHLTESHFPDPATDDLQIIRKRVADDEFTIVETTGLTQEDVTFTQAETMAKAQHLCKDEEFICAIDIRRARYSGVRPLPLRSVPGGSFVFEASDAPAGPLREETTRELREAVDISTLRPAERTPGDRLGRWQQKLLDLSMRNRLLNVREGKFAIQLLCPEVGAMEDILAAGKPLTIGSVARLLGDMDVSEIRNKDFSDLETPLQSLLKGELRQHRLWAFLSEKELERSLKALFRESRTDLEDGGVNTLFLAIGFLEWMPATRTSTCFHAPILLVPVRMDRGAVADGVKLVRIDEDTVVNETLLELLRTEFGIEVPGLSPLPTDASGIDVPLVLDIFRQAVKDRAGWEVRPVAVLGRFSFGKFVMWNDLTARKADLAKNPLVQHLMSGNGVYEDGIEVFPESEVSSRIDPTNLFCPLSADSSQLAAVLYSAMGKSFVLHGPPGTGKSQTITNIIAHNLALGRRVLFVSEKKAALDVVHRRLSAIGLRPFCLELHSNKAGKADVMRQFEEALAVADVREPADWQAETNHLQSLRSELDRHVRELHREFPNGLSAYRCFTWALSHPNLPDTAWQLPGATTQSSEELDGLREQIRSLSAILSRTSNDGRNALPWLKEAVPEWSPVWERNILATSRRLRPAADALRTAVMPVADAFGIPAPDSVSGLYSLAIFVQSVADAGALPASLVVSDVAAEREKIEGQLERLRREAEWAAKLPGWDTEAIAGLDAQAFQVRFQSVRSASLIVRLFKTRGFLKEVRLLRKDHAGKITFHEVAEVLPSLLALADAGKEARDGDAGARRYLGDLLPKPDCPDEIRPEALDAAERALKTACALQESVQAVCPDDQEIKEKIVGKLRELLPDATSRLASGTPLCASVDALFTAWNGFASVRESFLQLLPCVASDDTLPLLLDHAAELIRNGPVLREAIACRAAKANAVNAGLGEFVAHLESSTVAPDELPDVFETAVRRSMLDAILEESPSLCRFTGEGQEERIRRFSELDDRYLSLSRKMVFARLAARLPSRRSGPCPDGTELGILKRECAKKARQKPIRLLLEQTPVLTPLLKPCFLMSPLSVAQYLPPDAAGFDLVVFDEASQIPVWDAIGVLARARQHIIVGDPKQMPPTNFFQKGEADADDPVSEDDVEDMESILDECIAAGMFSAYLDWHYRSRHESLIAFSNHHYYGDRLSTFPSAVVSDRLGVRFQFVQGGIYDRKKTRTNGKEAKALVDYVVARLLDGGARHRSVGIVTFSEAQRNLIEDLLEAARLRNKRLDKLLADETDEPLFVKNLENVQGDERDVILFSIGYAPDAEGKFSMNFGPLNRQGGERRLNVAITRAKEQVVVFSSIHGGQIDLSRTSAVGAAHLRYFLDYAEKGFGLHKPSASEAVGEGLAAVVGAFLEEHGWTVDRDLGASGCRIDLAVRHPDREDDYLLGILCDGPGYAAQPDTRDREHLRAAVLRGMGWRLVHVWTVDWALDRRRAEERLLAALEEAKTVPIPMPCEPQAGAEPEPGSAEDETPPAESVSSSRKPYTPWIGAAPLPQVEFYEAETLPVLRRQICDILAAEAPIRESLLRRRLAKAWGFSRVGRGIVDVVTRSIPPGIPVTGDGENRVFWDKEQDPAHWHDWRVAETADERRDIADIPPEEIANAMYEILLGFQSCGQEALYRETLKELGYSTLTERTRPYLDAALGVLRRVGKV